MQAPAFGSPERQAVTDEVHAEMLKREAQVLLLLIDHASMLAVAQRLSGLAVMQAASYLLT